MPYTHLFFDIDHTLWDFEKNSNNALKILYAELELKNRGIANVEDFISEYNIINEQLWERFRKGFLSRSELRWKRMFKTLTLFKINNYALAQYMSERYLEILPTQTHVFHYAIDILEYCKSNQYKLYTITNGFHDTQLLKLKNSGMESYFTEMFSSEITMSMKPNKEIFEYALLKTNATAKNSLMIGDTYEVDIIGANNVNMDAVYFNPKRAKHNYQPQFEISCLSELKTILTKTT